MRISFGVLSVVAALCVATLCIVCGATAPRSTPEAARYGWAGPELLATSTIRDQVPVFSLESREIESDAECVIRANAPDNATKNVQLWKAVRALNDNADPKIEPQAIGDCTAQGAAYAVCVLSAVQIVEQLQPATWRRVHVPFIYGTARTLVGKGRLRGEDGGLGVWAAEAVRRHGVLSAEAAKAPAYSAAIARQWGDDGPPAWALDLGSTTIVRTIARVDSANAVRDAICNGYPVTVASRWGTRGYRQLDGRIVALGNGSWSHQMCIDGYDGTASQPLYHVRNSWGSDAHPKPIDGSPAGGFWVDAVAVNKMVAAGDSYAFSSFSGFPLQILGVVCDDRSTRVAVLDAGVPGDGSLWGGNRAVSPTLAGD